MRGKNLRHRAPSHPSNLPATFSAVRSDRQLEICLKMLQDDESGRGFSP